MKYYLIAGEASGDLHGSNLMKSILAADSEAEFRFWGGDQMAQTGGQPVKHIRDLAFMGFIEVFMNIRTILGNIKFCKKDIESFQPDALILIDYPGFNLRIAEFAHQRKIKVHYYISPQVWAWKQKRVFKIKACVDEMYCILPFEKDFYAQFNMDVHFVGHPLLDAIDQFQSRALTSIQFEEKYQIDKEKILALLPGSRKQEIKKKLPIMLAAAKSFDSYQIVIAGAPNIDTSFYQELAAGQSIKVIENDTYNLLNQSNLAMVTSGTATLETALFGVPQVVCYKGSWFSYQIAKRLIKVKYISLVNLILDRQAVNELIQQDLTRKNLVDELKRITKGETHDRLVEAYDELREILGKGGASKNVTSILLKKLKDETED